MAVDQVGAEKLRAHFETVLLEKLIESNGQGVDLLAGGAPLIVHNCENLTQAVARDVIAHNLPAVQAAGYDVLLTVHDEDITEAPDTDAYSGDALAEIMARVPPWATGLPLAAAGFDTYFYRKD